MWYSCFVSISLTPVSSVGTRHVRVLYLWNPVIFTVACHLCCFQGDPVPKTDVFVAVKTCQKFHLDRGTFTPPRLVFRLEWAPHLSSPVRDTTDAPWSDCFCGLCRHNNTARLTLWFFTTVWFFVIGTEVFLQYVFTPPGAIRSGCRKSVSAAFGSSCILVTAEPKVTVLLQVFLRSKKKKTDPDGVWSFVCCLAVTLTWFTFQLPGGKNLFIIHNLACTGAGNCYGLCNYPKHDGACVYRMKMSRSLRSLSHAV